MKDLVKDDVDLVLEGLDEESSEELSEDFGIELPEDTSLEDSLENVDQNKPRIKKDLFAGYLGELNEAPNPLEYGANATYRNLREGIVYKKGPDNLWEVFVKDGAPGRQGPPAPGGGCGVAEVRKEIDADKNTLGSPSNPFSDTASRNSWAAANPGRLVGARKWTVIGGVVTEQAWAGAWESASTRSIPTGVTRLSMEATSDAPTISVAADGSAWPNIANVDTDSTLFFQGGRTPAYAALQNKVPSNSELLPTLYSFSIDAPFQAVFFGDGDVLRMWVDGKYVPSTQVLTNSTFTRLDMSWPTYRRRVISILAQQFSGVRLVVNKGSVAPAPVGVGSLVVIGDSWVVGGINVAKMSGLWAQKVSQAKAFEKYFCAGDSGTGYAVTANGPVYGDATRFTSDVEYTPSNSYVIVSSSINDAGQTALAMNAGCVSLFDKIKAKFLPSRVIVIGPPRISTVNSTQNAANETIIAAQASAYGFSFISTLGWLTGTGRAGATVGDGNQDYYLGSDGSHLTPLGHEYWASKIVDATKSLF